MNGCVGKIISKIDAQTFSVYCEIVETPPHLSQLRGARVQKNLGRVLVEAHDREKQV